MTEQYLPLGEVQVQSVVEQLLQLHQRCLLELHVWLLQLAANAQVAKVQQQDVSLPETRRTTWI